MPNKAQRGALGGALPDVLCLPPPLPLLPLTFARRFCGGLRRPGRGPRGQGAARCCAGGRGVLELRALRAGSRAGPGRGAPAADTRAVAGLK